MSKILDKLKNFVSVHGKSIFLLTALGLGVFFIYRWVTDRDKRYEDLIGQVEKYKQLTEYVAQLEIKYQDQKMLNEELKKSWGTERSNMLKKVKSITEATFTINDKVRNTEKADLIYGKDGQQKYVFHELRFMQPDGAEGPPVGYVMIFEDGHVVSKLYHNDVNVKTAVTQDPDSGRYRVLTKADYILRQAGLANRKDYKGKNWVGVPYPLNVTGGVVLIDPTESADQPKKFRLWDPHLDLGLNTSFTMGGKFGFNPNLGFSVASYGRSKKDNTFRFLRVGVGGSKSDGVQVNGAPIMYNLGDKISILSNTWVYPTVAWSSRSGISFGLGMSLSF